MRLCARLRRTLLAAFFGALLLPQPALGAPPPTIRVSNGEWPPFLGQDLPHHGLVSRIVSEAFAAAGIRAEYAFFPWARAYHVALREDFDASVAWYKNAERSAEFLFSEPVLIERQVLFHLRDTRVAWKTLADLRNVTIGATIGYIYGDEFKAAEESGVLSVERTTSDEQNLRKLLAGRVNAALISEHVGADLLRAKFSGHEAASVVAHSRAVHTGTLHVIFAKHKPDSARWLATFNRGLARLRASGRLAELAKARPAPAAARANPD